MSHGLEATFAAADRQLYHQYGAAIHQAETRIWDNPDLNVLTDPDGASCIIVAPHEDRLLGVVRDSQGLYVERHIEMSGPPCDSLTLTPDGGTCWERLASGKRIPHRLPVMPRMVLSSILRRLTDPHPGRAGYLQFRIGKETEPVVHSMSERGHAFRHPVLHRALGEWGIVASAGN